MLPINEPDMISPFSMDHLPEVPDKKTHIFFKGYPMASLILRASFLPQEYLGCWEQPYSWFSIDISIYIILHPMKYLHEIPMEPI
jgi:hypothetical protein